MAFFKEGLILSNCGLGAFCQKRKDGTIAQQAMIGVVSNGELAPALSLGFSGKPKFYQYSILNNMIEGGVYDITGKVTPIDTPVYLSIITGTSPEELLSIFEEEKIVGETIPNEEDQSFSFTNIAYTGEGIYCIWTKHNPDYASMSEASLEAKAVRINEVVYRIQKVPISIVDYLACSICKGVGKLCEKHLTETVVTTCPLCSGTGTIEEEVCPNCNGERKVCSTCAYEGLTGELTASCSTCGSTGVITQGHFQGSVFGTCPRDVDVVYISIGTEDQTQEELESTIKSNAMSQPNENELEPFSYEISLNDTTGNYVVWCISELETGLTAEFDGTFQESTPCLSGDTYITMANGELKRLSKIQPGDKILAGDGSSTVVLKTARGIWQPFHILYYFEDGTIIDEISDHRFFNVEQGFWQKLNRWNIGDHAKRQDGKEIALIKKERVDEPAECFGLWTESHEHFANGLLGGEAAANIPFIEDAELDYAMDMVMSLTEEEIEKMFYGGIL